MRRQQEVMISKEINCTNAEMPHDLAVIETENIVLSEENSQSAAKGKSDMMHLHIVSGSFRDKLKQLGERYNVLSFVNLDRKGCPMSFKSGHSESETLLSIAQ